MQKCPPHYFLLLLCLGFFISGCKNSRKHKGDPLASVNVTRGELLICGSGEFGQVSNNLSCDAETREIFALAMALLHSFEYTEAEKAFAKVIDINPDCAMAYWGIAMCNFHPLWAPPGKEELEKGSRILEIAKDLNPSGQVGDYLDAIRAFYTDWERTDHATRTSRFEVKMAGLYDKYPEDTEAAIFYALALNAAADPSDKSYLKQRKAGALLESLFPQQPDHPGIAHYIIHNYDYPELSYLALPTARRYAQIAPSSAHAQHMPSHIFTRLGLWEESINSNLNSTASALCYAESLEQNAHWDEELHGMDYLVYAYLQRGENRKAREQFEYMESFENIFPVNFKVAYTAAAIPARLALENKDWKSATQLELPLARIIPWDEYPWQRSLVGFARAMGFVRLGNIGQAEVELEQLQANKAELLNRGEGYQANQVDIQIVTIEGWLLLTKGDKQKGLARMKEAVEMETNTAKHPVSPGEVLPAGELLADMLLDLGMAAKALEAHETDMKRNPNRFNGIYGAAVAANQSGNREKARSYYQQLLESSSSQEDERQELKEARAFIEETEY